MVACVVGIALALVSGRAVAAPVGSPWVADGPDDSAAVAAAAVSGWYALADTLEDTVELRDIRGDLRATITKAEIEALVPWMSLGAGADGPSALALSDSGRLLFILVHDSASPGDGLGSDAILKYDVYRETLVVFARLEASSAEASAPAMAMAHHAGRLYVGTDAGDLVVYRALRNDGVGTALSTSTLPIPGSVRGIAVDRIAGEIYVASDQFLFWGAVGAAPPVLSVVGLASGEIRAIAYADQFGDDATDGVYMVTDDAGTSNVRFVPRQAARGLAAFSDAVYVTPGSGAHDIAASACGRLLVGLDEDAVMYADTSDPNLGFDAWAADEFAQVVSYARGLIAPDGEPDGWVIDTDVSAGGTRFHPATPDAAGWAVLLLIADEEINGTASNRERVRTILRRYAGLMPDGFAPGVSADGQMRHWADPFSTTGQAKPGWPVEFASLSTMKIVLGAARAASYYPGDAQIQEAAETIIGRVTERDGWDTYIQPGTDALYFISAGAAPNFGSASSPFHEGIIFVEQAAAYGQSSQAAYNRWLDRSRWPAGTFLTGQPITSGCNGCFQAAFVSLYSVITQGDFRASPEWQAHTENLLASNSGWTDDNGARFFTVFSAGTTKGIWGGYNADSLGNHPGDISTFPSVMAFGATGDTAPVVGAYHAYRAGARQAWATGAEFLYRRSDVDPAYSPNSAGLPDVGIGALGLAEILQPGIVDSVLAVSYPDFDACPADIDGDGDADPDDIGAFVDAFVDAVAGNADIDGDGDEDPDDITAFVAAFVAGCG